MTDHVPDTHPSQDATGPLALKSNLVLGPLPEYAHEFRPRWFGDDGGFTGAQMRLYAMEAVAAERERWQAHADAMAQTLEAFEAQGSDKTAALRAYRAFRA
jgi:hypothetical protein